MKTKDINSVFGVAPATLFDWNKSEHKKNRLAKLLKNITIEEVESLLAKNSDKVKPMMLLSTVNCSIGDKSKHFTLTGLKKLFYKKTDLNPYEKYALKVIKKEAMKEEIEDFINYYKIPHSRVNKAISA